MTDQIVKDQHGMVGHAIDSVTSIEHLLGRHAVRSMEVKEHQVGLEPTLPHYECGVLAAGRPVLSVLSGTGRT